MAKSSVAFAESAVRDLEEMQAWHERELGLEVGQRLARKIFERVEALQDNPDMGRVVPEFGQKYIRELIHSPFRVVYRRDNEKVRVVRLWMSERLLRLSGQASV